MSPRSEALNPSRESIAAAGHDLAMGLRAAYLAMHRRANAEFAHLGLTTDQFVILTALAEADGVTQKELARRTASDANTMSEMLGRLEQRGLIARERDADDGRARRVSLTACGREVQRRAWDGVATFRETIAGLMPSDELRILVGRLRRIVGAMTDPGGNA
jgi:DNA-binding MarR family transcriptional regulator